jgi:hypothetical protein
MPTVPNPNRKLTRDEYIHPKTGVTCKEPTTNPPKNFYTINLRPDAANGLKPGKRAYHWTDGERAANADLEAHAMTYLPIISKKFASEGPLYDVSYPLQAFSITIEHDKDHVSVEWLNCMYEFMQQFMVSGLIGVEWGRKMGNRHLQMVAIAHGPHDPATEVTLSNHIKKWLDIWTGEKYHIAVKLCEERGKYAFMYVLGYCMKDRCKPNFKFVAWNLTEEMIREGIAAYNRVSIKPGEDRTTIKRSTMFIEVYKFWHANFAPLDDMCFYRILTYMLQTDDFILDQGFATDRRSVMETWQVQSIWRLTTRPIKATRKQVMHAVNASSVGSDGTLDISWSLQASTQTSTEHSAPDDGNDSDEYADVTFTQARAKALAAMSNELPS